MHASSALSIEFICLSYAGGSAGVYAPMRRLLPDWLSLNAFDLPGHGRRIREPLQSERASLIRQLVAELRDAICARPYVLYGHSLGGLLSFELCHALAALGLPEPLMLFVSAADAPLTRDLTLYDRVDTDEQLMATLKRLGGTPAEVLASPELMELALPVLRADFKLCSGPVQRTREQLRCPIRAFAGVRDRLPVSSLEAWRSETRGSFALERFDGDHFFLRSHLPQVTRSVIQHVSACLSERPSSPRDLSA